MAGFFEKCGDLPGQPGSGPLANGGAPEEEGCGQRLAIDLLRLEDLHHLPGQLPDLGRFSLLGVERRQRARGVLARAGLRARVKLAPVLRLRRRAVQVRRGSALGPDRAQGAPDPLEESGFRPSGSPPGLRGKRPGLDEGGEEEDVVFAFQWQEEAERFFRVLPKRLAKYGLELSAEKSRMVRFSRFQLGKNSERFDFLGFEFRWVVDHKGTPRVTCRTSRKRLRASLARVTEWIKAERHSPVRQLVEALNARLRGHYNYYGVIGNHRSLCSFFYQARRLLMKWLGRRSRKSRMTWEKFNALVERFLWDAGSAALGERIGRSTQSTEPPCT
jgi:hypothetical protein